MRNRGSALPDPGIDESLLDLDDEFQQLSLRIAAASGKGAGD
jgi:hypothetical protein